VFVIVFTAFFGTGITDIGADGTEFGYRLPAQAHYLRCRIADCGAFHIQPYTGCHHLHIFFPGAGCRTMVT
jgi:hypothetical protein